MDKLCITPREREVVYCREMKKKKIWLTTDKKKYCWVKVYNTKKEMQEAYEAFRPGDKNHDKVEGAHCGYERHRLFRGKWRVHEETAIVFLCKERCGAGVVTHELMHAVLWARQHKFRFKQYPVIIKSMDSSSI